MTGCITKLQGFESKWAKTCFAGVKDATKNAWMNTTITEGLSLINTDLAFSYIYITRERGINQIDCVTIAVFLT